MTPTQTVTHSSAAPERCRCGNTDCQGGCGKLDCLTRPNFFCGQLLTDGDLKAMVDWIEAKSALQRFREGWGVVCGLDVSCSHKHKEQTRVYVSEGYAVDCCGRDIVVCDPLWYDFKCEKPFDPCCRDPQQERALIPPIGDGTTVETGLGSIPLSEIRAFELCLRFDEQMGGGQRAMVRGNCSPMDDCQFTRVREKGKLIATEIKNPCMKPLNVEEKYRRDLKLFLGDLDKRVSFPKDLVDWISGKLHSFCFVEDSLCTLVNETTATQRVQTVSQQQLAGAATIPAVQRDIYSNLIFYIVQDWRNHYFECLCESCKDNACEGDGVPLARVWVWDKNEGGCRKCKVVYIDSYPPYRRLLSRACWPSHPGCVDLSRHIWRGEDEVLQELARSGFTRVNPVELREFTKDTIKGFLATLAGEHDLICAPAGSSLAMKVFPDVCGRNRVVAFEIVQT